MASNWFDDEAGFYDFLMFVAMYAPDFPEEDFLNADEQLTLDRAFDELATGLQMMQNRLSNDRFQKAQQLLANALNAYRAGDDMTGTHTLQTLDRELFGRGR